MKLIISILLLTLVTFAQNTTYMDGTECECDSIHVDYYESGSIRAEFPYKNGYRNGIGKWYYENGKLAGTANYKNGTLTGYKKCTDGRMGNENLDCLN